MGKFSQMFYEGKGSARKYFPEDKLNRIGGFKSRSILVDMKIDEFLSLALPLDDIDYDDIDQLMNVEMFEDVPFINTDLEEVTGHEGRHRAVALKELGYDTMPVEFRDRVIRWDKASKYPKVLRSEDGRSVYTYPIVDGEWVGLESFKPKSKERTRLKYLTPDEQKEQEKYQI